MHGDFLPTPRQLSGFQTNICGCLLATVVGDFGVGGGISGTHILQSKLIYAGLFSLCMVPLKSVV